MPANHDIEELAKLDLRRSSFHEAGHLVVAEHYGLKGEASVFRTYAGDLLNNHWVGRFTPLKGPQPSECKWAVIGWAGAVAEGLSDIGLSTWRAEVEEVWCDYELGDQLSESDQTLIEKWPNRCLTFYRAVSIIERNYVRLRDAAEKLILSKYVCNL
nr:hypothetical protein [Nitrosomonas nitrosa]